MFSLRDIYRSKKTAAATNKAARLANAFRDASEVKVLARLRRRFIFMVMSLVGATMAIMLASGEFGTFQIRSAEINTALNAAVGVEEGFVLRPHIGEFRELREPGGGGGGGNPAAGTTIVSLTSQPVFVVMYDNLGGWYETFNNSAAMDDTVLAEAVTRVLQENSSRGLIAEMGLSYARSGDFTGSGKTRIAFADASSLLSSTAQGAVAAVVIWLVAMALVLLISLYLSHIALRPVVDAWQKQRRFVADASHELKTPLTVILANTNIIASDPEAKVSEQSQWLESTQVEAQRMDGLIRDLLFLAQTDEEQAQDVASSSSHSWRNTQQQPPENSSANNPASERLTSVAASPLMPAAPSKSNLSNVVSRALLQFDAVFFEREIVVEQNIASDVFVRGSAEQLDRLVSILLDNASKYSPPGGTVQVVLSNSSTAALTKTSMHATLKVANSGEPIPAATLEHLFERFYRGDAAHSDAVEGYGLGLSIAERIVFALGGSIQATSDAEHGTVFTLTLA